MTDPSPGTHELWLETGAISRRYLLRIPPCYDGRKKLPVVLDLHASSISPEMHLRITGMDRSADREGFLLVAPEAIAPWPDGGTTWNIPHDAAHADDIAFIRDLLDAVETTAAVDTDRIYVCGYSGGARLACELAWVHADRFAAIGVVAGLRRPIAETGGRRSVPIIAFHSTDDPVNPYHLPDTQCPQHWDHDIDTAIEDLCGRMDYERTAEETEIVPGITRCDFTDERGNIGLSFYRLTGTGHTWPGSDFPYPDFVGSVEHRIDATRLILEFFRKHGGGAY